MLFHRFTPGLVQRFIMQVSSILLPRGDPRGDAQLRQLRSGAHTRPNLFGQSIDGLRFRRTFGSKTDRKPTRTETGT